VQQRLLTRLPNAATRPRVTFLDDPETSAKLSAEDVVIGELVQNPSEIAATNAATPSSTLVTLLRDPESDVRNLAAGDPSTPLEALDTVRAASSWILANPRVPITLLHRLLDRALLDDDYDVVNACKKVLAARTLRAGS
jgi:hypothetical protein